MTKWLKSDTSNPLLVADTGLVDGGKIEYLIKERPLLHGCCNKDKFGTINFDVDPNVNPDVVLDVTKRLPFKQEEFEAGFMDTPWIQDWKWELGKAIKEMLRCCKVVYVICPWLYGWKGCKPEEVHVSWRPGINHPVLFVKYVKTEKFWAEYEKHAEKIKKEHNEKTLDKYTQAMAEVKEFAERTKGNDKK